MNIGVHVSLWILVFSGYMPSSVIAGSYSRSIPSLFFFLFLVFLRNLYTVLHTGCIKLHSHQTVQEGSLFSTSSPAFIVCRFFLMVTILTSVRWQLIVVLICISLIMSDVEHLFIYMLSICMSSWRNVCLGLPRSFWLGCLFFWYWAAWASCVFWRLILC